MTRSKTTGEFDTEEVKAINAFIANAPEYFKRTDKLYDKYFGNGEPGMDEQLRLMQTDLKRVIAILETSDPITTKRKVDDLFTMGRTVTNAVIVFLVTAGIGGVIFLIRMAPTLEQLAKQP